MSPPSPKTSPRPRRRGVFRRIVIVGVLAAALWAGWQWWTWPDVAALAHERPRTTAFMERERARQLREGREPRIRWRWVPYRRISPHLKRAVLVGEDIGFFAHEGFEVTEIRASLRAAWEDGELPRGASTLTQQLAKNLWLTPSWNPLRKLEEAILTVQLERALSKRRILELYLNVVEFGPGVYGAEAAARHYYGTSAAGLDAAQAARLAAGLPRPSSWHPGSRSRAYRRHVKRLMARMARAEFLWKQI